MNYDDAYRMFDLSPGDVASLDQFDKEVNDRIDQAVNAMIEMRERDDTPPPPPTVVAGLVAYTVGADPTAMDEPLTVLAYMYAYAMERLMKIEMAKRAAGEDASDEG